MKRSAVSFIAVRDWSTWRVAWYCTIRNRKQLTSTKTGNPCLVTANGTENCSFSRTQCCEMYFTITTRVGKVIRQLWVELWNKQASKLHLCLCLSQANVGRITLTHWHSMYMQYIKILPKVLYGADHARLFTHTYSVVCVKCRSEIWSGKWCCLFIFRVAVARGVELGSMVVMEAVGTGWQLCFHQSASVQLWLPK